MGGGGEESALCTVHIFFLYKDSFSVCADNVFVDCKKSIKRATQKMRENLPCYCVCVSDLKCGRHGPYHDRLASAVWIVSTVSGLSACNNPISERTISLLLISERRSACHK